MTDEKFDGNHMVSIIENRSLISGTIVSVAEDADARGFAELIFELAGAGDLAGYPNLAKDDEGKEIRLRMQKAYLERSGMKKGDTAELIVRKAFRQVYFVQE
jgi:hypothetical protein